MRQKILTIFLLLIILLPVIWPLLQPGFLVTDDGDWMIIRLSAFHETLKTGQFPVRFLYPLNHGYGYPVTDFLYPLPFYLGELIHLMGFGFIDSVKILFIASFILGAFFMYLYSGPVAAVIYTYFPYRLFDIYKRGSLGESMAFIFLPLIFYLIDKRKTVLTAIATAALITSHNVLAFMFFPVIIIYSRNLKMILLALLLSAWFWLPAIYDLQFTKASLVQVADFSKYFLWSF